MFFSPTKFHKCLRTSCKKINQVCVTLNKWPKTLKSVGTIKHRRQVGKGVRACRCVWEKEREREKPITCRDICWRRMGTQIGADSSTAHPPALTSGCSDFEPPPPGTMYVCWRSMIAMRKR